jgi:long-subunit fatty acid transport protein
MIKTLPAIISSLFISFLLAFPVSSPAQLVIGQYEDEAPLRTWNTFGLATAASIGRGETMLALADDCSAALSNPALLAGLPKFTLSLNGSYSRTALYRYAIVNTGVLVSEGNLGIGLFALDFGGLSYRIGGWTFALAAAVSEIYDRPQAYAESIYDGVTYASVLFNQSGFLRTINLAVARSVGRRFQVGIGLNVVQGELERNVEDQYLVDEITISQHTSQSFSGLYLNGGLLARITDQLDLAFAFRTSYDKKSESGSSYRYQASPAGTDILIQGTSDDFYHQPWAAGLGARYEISPGFRVLGDLTYFHWSGYKAEYFGENEKRDFKPAFKAALGGEYYAPVRLFKKDATIPLRLGFCYDRQPMSSPGSAYAIFSMGIGLHWGSIALDIGGQVGRESGSGNGLKVTRLSISLGAGIEGTNK